MYIDNMAIPSNSKHQENAYKFLEFLNQNKSKIERVTKERLFKLTNTKDHQGIAVNASDFKYFELVELLTKDIKKIIIEFYLDSAIYYAKNKVAFDNLVSKIKPY